MAILNRGTLVLVGCAIALGGAVLFLENRADTTAETTEPNSELASTAQETGELMFPFAESDIESFTLSRPNEVLTFAKDKEGFWRMSSPQEAEAEGGAIAFLLNQLTSTAVRSLEVAPDTLARFSLNEPEVTIDLVAEGKPYKFLVGDVDFTGEQRYVRAFAAEEVSDEAEDTVDIHLVSGSITNAVERPTEEWIVSPEAESNGGAAGETTPDEASEEPAPDEGTEEAATQPDSETEGDSTPESDTEDSETEDTEPEDSKSDASDESDEDSADN